MGDAVCDGGYLDFDHFPQFEDLSDEVLNDASGGNGRRRIVSRPVLGGRIMKYNR